MRRVSMVGPPGSGKSTLGRALAARLGVPFVELDSIFHQPGWEPLPVAEFRARVAEVVAGDGWVVDGNYSVVRDLVWGWADTIVWFDRPRWVVMWRVTQRTVRRVLGRRDLWNGNRETLRCLLPVDPAKSVIAWAWLKHPVYRAQFRAAAKDNPHFVRVATDAQARNLLSGA